MSLDPRLRSFALVVGAAWTARRVVAFGRAWSLWRSWRLPATWSVAAADLPFQSVQHRVLRRCLAWGVDKLLSSEVVPDRAAGLFSRLNQAFGYRMGNPWACFLLRRLRSRVYPDDGILLGRAFRWSPEHTQELETHLQKGKPLPVGRDSRGGYPALHAVGKKEETAAGAAVERAGGPRAHRRHDPERQDAAPGSDPVGGHSRSRYGHRYRSQGRRRTADPGGERGAPRGKTVRLLRPGLPAGVDELQPARHVHVDHRAGRPGAGPHARRRRHVQGRPVLHGISPGRHREDRRRAGGGGRPLDHRRTERCHDAGAALRRPGRSLPVSEGPG